MQCFNCDAEIKKGEYYYEVTDVNICDNCIDEYLSDLKDDVKRYLPTNEEVEAEKIIDERLEKC